MIYFCVLASPLLVVSPGAVRLLRPHLSTPVNRIILLNYRVSTLQSEQQWRGVKQTDTHKQTKRNRQISIQTGGHRSETDRLTRKQAYKDKVILSGIAVKSLFNSTSYDGSAAPCKTDPTRGPQIDPRRLIWVVFRTDERGSGGTLPWGPVL